MLEMVHCIHTRYEVAVYRGGWTNAEEMLVTKRVSSYLDKFGRIQNLQASRGE